MGAARETWRTIGGELLRLGVLGEADLATFAVYCQTAARWRQAEEAMRDRENSPDLPARAAAMPLLARTARRACDDMMRLAGEFGLTPISRKRLALDGRGGER
jgi:P27 family predicted phage terminase small subunit